MNTFIIDAATIGLKEGLKLAVIWLVFYSFLCRHDRKDLMRPFYVGLVVASLLVVVSMFVPPTLLVKDIIVRMIGYVFFLFFLASVAALYQTSGVNLFGPLRGIASSKRLLQAVVIVSTVVYLAPDIIGSSMFVREMFEMQGNSLSVYATAAVGFVIPVALMFPLLGRVRDRLGAFFGLAQLLLFLSVVKLIAGGVSGFAELSLIPSVQRGVMKLVHDCVHQIFLFVMVPDHPLLKTTVWNFIGILFGSNIGLFAALLVLLLPPVMFLSHSFLDPLPDPPMSETGAERRAYRASVRAERRKRALPAALFVAVILASWFGSSGGSVSQLYNPAPKPLVDDKGIVLIPLTDPTMDLMDGRIHKFTISSGGETIGIMVIEKPDGKLAVCLDACEICPPEGYGQTEGHVVCLYCRTPIPVGTLGQSGGCNPIPLNAQITDTQIRIDMSDIQHKWKEVTSGKLREGILK